MADYHEFGYMEILNAIPMPIFLVDEDVRIIDLNRTAIEMFGITRDLVYLKRGGEVLHCLHADDVDEGCGRGPSCRNCVIRSLVGNSLKGIDTTRRRMKFERRVNGKVEEGELLISVHPLPSHASLALVMLDDITALPRLQSIIPICVRCKRIRNDDQYWQKVENYFNEYIGVEFSHGYCPECLEAWKKE